jgi:hypothetical protein
MSSAELGQWGTGADRIKAVLAMVDGRIPPAVIHPRFRLGPTFDEGIICIICGRSDSEAVVVHERRVGVHQVGVCYHCARKQLAHRLLSIDPAMGRLGWAVLQYQEGVVEFSVVSEGAWKPSTAKAKPDRYQQLAEFVLNQIRTFNPTDVLVETPGKHQRFIPGSRKMRPFDSIMVTQRASAICFGAAANLARSWTVDPQGWKGGQKKSDTARLLSLQLGQDRKPTDETDAIAMGEWWFRCVYPILMGRWPVEMLPASVGR